MDKLIKVWDLPAGCSISRVAIRETFGADERAAARLVEAAGRGQTNLGAELCKLAIVAFWDRQGVKHVPEAGSPCLELEDWNTRTRDLVMFYFDTLNGTDPATRAGFLAGGQLAGPTGEPFPTASAPELPAPASSPST